MQIKLGLCSTLLIVFITLKLTKLITWSWLWVLAPLWIPVLIGFGILFVVGVIHGLVILENKRGKL